MRLKVRPQMQQFARYAAVGVVNTIVTLSAYSALVATHVGYVTASAVGYSLGAATSYLGNRTWTFAGTTTRHLITAPRYLAVMLVGLGTDVALIAMLVDGLRTQKHLAQALVIPAVAVVTFSLNRRWAFRDPGYGSQVPA